MKVKSESEVAQLCPTLSAPMDCSPPGSSTHGFSRQEDWSGVPLPSPIVEPYWDPNNGGIPLLEHCRRCILTGLQKGMQSQKQQMISVRFQGKPFNITVIQVYAPTSNAEEAEVERFYEDLQDLLELTPKKMSFSF